MRIGITGQSGFVGNHLFNILGLNSSFERVPFEDSFFEDEQHLRTFVKQCDVIVHLAAVNRDPNPIVIYNTNLILVRGLISAMEVEGVTPHLIFSSSIQEERDNLYGKSKREGRELLEEWAKRVGATFTGLVIPNVYGPFSKPNYNTFIATFAHQLINGETPNIQEDGNIKLVYVNSLCSFIINQIINAKKGSITRVDVPYDFEKRVSKILSLFISFKELYAEKGFIPNLKDINEVNLFNTFRSYLNYSTHFPVKLVKNSDPRGFFVETIKLGIGGQVSFSTTIPGVTRGNHYHTRKIERFTVIRGKARIQLRKIGSEDVINLFLDGNEPSYVDMPVWYTHNITNIGEEELYTQFWINEWYNPQDGDTFFEEV
ncbi:MAG: epimerase [Bacteroidetes bacterium HGW-Bacteroidetes-8]|jgi:UDP-2-acetamido-2,6-beta-L-arabino-hexul-4-ose reductase|nr:MAG: epimerase [Bacteroidetes bacterium HGW-Bacteroidetes-8]